MAQQTATEWLINQLWDEPKDKMTWYGILKHAKEIEEKNIKDAMMYALDEDGHTGDWKIKFIDKYYNQKFKTK